MAILWSGSVEVEDGVRRHGKGAFFRGSGSCHYRGRTGHCIRRFRAVIRLHCLFVSGEGVLFYVNECRGGFRTWR